MITHSLRCLGIAGAFAVCIASGRADAAPPAAVPQATIAILPEAGGGQEKTFTLSSKPIKEFSLSFDVRAVPAGATVLSAKLRIVPCTSGEAPDQPQDIRIFATIGQTDPQSIGQLVKSRDVSPIESIGDGLKTAVADAVRAETPLPLTLRTPSRTPAQTYYLNSAIPPASAPPIPPASTAASTSASTSANTVACSEDEAPTGKPPRVSGNRSPRLLVEFSGGDFVARQGANLRYRDGNSNATPWRHDLSAEPDENAVLVSEPSAALDLDTIFAGPAFIGDKILLVAKPPSGSPTLYAVGWNGTKIWEAGLPKLTNSLKQWKYILADDQDRLLAFASDSTIRVYSGLGSQAPAKPTFEKKIPELEFNESPLLTMGGMIVYRNGDFVYALSPLGGEGKANRDVPTGWEPLMKFGRAGLAQMAISPWNGENLLYGTPVVGTDNKRRSGIAVFDPARGVQRFPLNDGEPTFPDSDLAAFPDYNPLQVLALDPGKDLALVSGSGDPKSVVRAYWGLTSPPPGGWSRSAASISSCIASPLNGDGKTSLYCVDGSATEQELRKLSAANGEGMCSRELKKQLKPSSNLVADGAGNVFFWVGRGKDAGFYGFNSDCKNIVFSRLESSLPDGALDLHAGPNGVFYLTDSTRLIAIDPVRKTTSVAELSKDTRYSADGDLTILGKKAPADGPVIVATGGNLALGDLQVPKGGDVTCSARGAVTFGNGFRVEQGGVLRCGIDSAARIPR